MSTRREKIVELLSAAREPMDVRQIAVALGADPREADSMYDDLAHVARSLRGSSRVLLMQPPTCRACGYVFRDLERPKRPSKCPKCRGERISPPRFIIVEE